MVEIKKVIYKINDGEFDIEAIENFITEVVGSLQNDPINYKKIEKLAELNRVLKYMKSFYIHEARNGDEITAYIGWVPGLESHPYDIQFAGGGYARSRIGVDTARIDADKQQVIPIFATVWEFFEEPGEDDDYDDGIAIETKYRVGEYDPSSMTLTLYAKVNRIV